MAKSKTKKKKLKKLSEMSFDTLGDEYVFLYEVIYEKPFENDDEDDDNDDGDEDRQKSPDIEELRQDYNLLFNEQDIKGKYNEKNIYWSEIQEKSIIDYIEAKTPEEKSLIFSKSLYKPF